jgi:uncharacterized membrane protein
VLVIAVVLRFVASSALWLDEAMSVNIARLPLGDLHEALKHDGAPPLYYVLLHFWTDVFGTGDTAVRALSGVFSVATFPAVYFIGKRVGGRFTAWAAVLLYAVLPYSIRYGSETRMYALVMFLVAWGYLAFVARGGQAHRWAASPSSPSWWPVCSTARTGSSTSLPWWVSSRSASRGAVALMRCAMGRGAWLSR